MSDGPQPPKPPQQPGDGSGAERNGAGPPPPPGPKSNAGKAIQRKLSEALAVTSVGLAMRDPRRAEVLAVYGDELARVWARLADESPAVRRVLEQALAGSAWGEAIFITATVAIELLPEDFELPFHLPGFAVPPSEEVRETAERDGRPAASPPQPAPPVPPEGEADKRGGGGPPDSIPPADGSDGSGGPAGS